MTKASDSCKARGLDSKAVRAWAKANGLIGDQVKGRISVQVIEAYSRAKFDDAVAAYEDQ